MSNYTKTTDFEAKDSLPTGDSGKIIRGAEFETEFDAISTAIATKADTAGPTFTGTLTFETISDGTIGVTAFVDEDDMSSDSATLVPTQQSVKAYVDSQVTAQDLDFQADSGGALSIDLDSETMTFTGGTGIDTSGSGNAVTFAIDSTVATLTGTQTLTNKTLTSPDVNTPDIDGGTIDGTVIGGTTPAAVSATTVSATGNITVGGTVDGRDVATDGTKLDGIESGATADQTAAEIRTLVESATDSNVFTDADHTKLDGIEASADVTDTANVTAAGALMDSELTSEASVKALNQGVATTDSPTFAGVTVNGTVEFDGLSGTGAVSVTDILDQDDMSSNSATALATQQSIKAYVDSQVATVDTLAEVLANGNTTGGTDIAVGTGDDITFADSSKAIFGAGSDLQIYHDGTNSFINDTGTGNLLVRAADSFLLQDTGGKTYLKTVINAQTELSYNNSTKLATTSTGIDVTGTVVADGVTVDGNILLNNEGNELQFNTSSTPVNKIYTDDTYTSNGLTISAENGVALKSVNNYLLLDDTGTNEMVLNVDSGERMRVTATGIDVTGTVTADGLTVDVGSASTTVATFSSDNSNSWLNLESGADSGVFLGSNSGTFKLLTNTTNRLAVANNGDISFYEDTGTTAKLFWDASAESLGIGTSSVESLLTIDKDVSTAYDSTDDSAQRSNTNTLLLKNEDGTANSFAQIAFDLAGSGQSIARIVGLNDGTSSSALAFVTEGSNTKREVMRLDGSGNVGIGTSSPSKKLHIKGSTITGATADTNTLLYLEQNANNSIQINSGATNNGQIRFGDASSNYRGAITYQHSDDSLQFVSAGAERMRIDGSGNLLVGKTAASLSTAGVTAYGGGFNGLLASVRDGAEPLYLNRLTSDGPIASFQKDGTLVGSIGTVSTYLTIGKNDTGLLFMDASDYIEPFNLSTNAARDAAIDLGRSGARFKTLYLSNSVKNTSGALSVESGGGGQLLITASSELIFSSNAAERGRFNTSGNFLVGTTSSTLYSSSSETGTNITSQGGLYIAHNGTNLPVFNRITSDGDIADFRKNGAVVGSIGVSSGDLVIGTGVAGVRFKDSGPSLEPRAANGNGNDGGIDLGMSSSRWRNLYLSGGVRASTLKFENLAGTTEYARFDGSGNLLVGTTSNYSVSNMTLGFNAGSEFGLGLTDSDTGTATARMISFVKNGSLVGYINSTTGGTTYSTSSDQRLKDNIVDAPSASDDIDAIQVRSFDWKADGSHQKYGMVAQELQSVAPEAVSGDADSDDMMGVDYSKLVPMLVKEIQSLRARVAQLEGAN